ncbi:MAG: adenylate/guanylate cyclase domain-containing protein [Candidatus Schekmanbacteria bacterium]|nr:MAG: adenylate/guanylate cyclase domain-containing protein [Candidatus Schekmanbacteria bacterium]
MKLLKDFKLSPKKVGFITTLLIFVIAFYHGPMQRISIINRLELMTLDFRFKIRGVEKLPEDVKIVAIDNDSIKKIGRWPWDRKIIAKLVDKLSAASASVITLDIIFSEPQISEESKLISNLIEKIKKENKGNQMKALIEDLKEKLKNLDSDQILAESFENAGNVILAMSMNPFSPEIKELDSDTLENLARSSYFLEEDEANLKEEIEPIEAKEVLIPLNKFMDTAYAVGNAEAVSTDIDGVVRKEWMIEKYMDALYPCLALWATMVHLNADIDQLKIIFGESVQLKDINIPIDERGRYLISYYGPQGTVPYYSAVDVLEGKIDSDTFKDKMVFVGYAATGLGDKWVTPFGIMFGVEKQATIAQNFLDRKFLVHPALAILYDLFSILLIGTILSFTLTKLSPSKSGFLALAVFILVIIIISSIFIYYNIWINMVFPLLTTASLYVSITSYRFLTEEKEKRKIRGAFQQYLSPSVVNEVTKDPSKLKLGGEEKPLTILFSDIRGFTSISEALTPVELVHLLNEYFNEMTYVITEQNGGTLDKFIGDAIMAFWGAPVEIENHAEKACLSALGMMEGLKKLREKWDKEGKPPVDIGIGINTGNVVVGNMGSDRRFDYTVMGDGVNLASRLEGINKTYGTNIIISEFTEKEIPEYFIRREVDLVRVKGKLKPVKIYELMGTTENENGLIEKASLFIEGIKLYEKRKWKEAKEIFKAVIEKYPNDGPSKVYIERCSAYEISPPPEDWDGVFVMTTK